MAQQSQSEEQSSGIARAGKRKWGYEPGQVDEFLEHAHTLYERDDQSLTQSDIQNVSFDLAKNGYKISQVDATLTRLERAVVDKHTTWQITNQGRVAFKAQSEELYKSLQSHAQRAHKERFAPGKGKKPSYDRRQVDRLIDQIIEKAGIELSLTANTNRQALADINAQSVANVIFTQRKGKHGYDERQVDYYLNACVQLLTRLESYARVADYVSGATEEDHLTESQHEDSFDLFAGSMQTSSVPASFTEHNTHAADSDFDQLHRAEQAIFNADTVSQPMPPAPAPAVNSLAKLGSIQADTNMDTDFETSSPSVLVDKESGTPTSSHFDGETTAAYSPFDMPLDVQSSDTTQEAEHTEQTSSLAALAQMAQSLPEPERVQAASFEPHVPSLETPSVPSLSMPSLDNIGSVGDINIPDLSFPDFSTDTKSEQNSQKDENEN